MRHMALIGILILLITIYGCSKECNPDNQVDCDRSCNSEEDCIFYCGCGCINTQESCDYTLKALDCDAAACRCIDNICQ